MDQEPLVMTAGEALPAFNAIEMTLSIQEREDGKHLVINPPGMLPYSLTRAVARHEQDLIELVAILGDSYPPAFHGEVFVTPNADEVLKTERLIRQARQLGCRLFMRRQGNVGIRNGENLSDELLLRLAKNHSQISFCLAKEKRNPS